jgi:vancomycin aglycone glucosyltransferase
MFCVHSGGSVRVAATGCDIILGANAHQYAARSIAELHGIPYVNAVYAPTALPTEDNARTWNRSVLGSGLEPAERLG